MSEAQPLLNASSLTRRSEWSRTDGHGDEDRAVAEVDRVLRAYITTQLSVYWGGNRCKTAGLWIVDEYVVGE